MIRILSALALVAAPAFGQPAPSPPSPNPITVSAPHVPTPRPEPPIQPHPDHSAQALSIIQQTNAQAAGMAKTPATVSPTAPKIDPTPKSELRAEIRSLLAPLAKRPPTSERLALGRRLADVQRTVGRSELLTLEAVELAGNIAQFEDRKTSLESVAQARAAIESVDPTPNRSNLEEVGQAFAETYTEPEMQRMLDYYGSPEFASILAKQRRGAESRDSRMQQDRRLRRHLSLEILCKPETRGSGACRLLNAETISETVAAPTP